MVVFSTLLCASQNSSSAQPSPSVSKPSTPLGGTSDRGKENTPRPPLSQAWLRNPAWIGTLSFIYLSIIHKSDTIISDGGMNPPHFYYTHEQIAADVCTYGGTSGNPPPASTPQQSASVSSNANDQVVSIQVASSASQVANCVLIIIFFYSILHVSDIMPFQL
jgi:hypothetical protein